MSTRTILVALLLCLTPYRAHAQVVALVYDAQNDLKNSLLLAEAVRQTFQQALDLTPLDEIVMSEDLAATMTQLGDIVAESSALSWDIRSLNAQIQALFALDTAPNTLEGLEVRMREIRHLIFDARLYAIRTQALAQTMASTVRHLVSLVSSIKAFVGNLAGQQSLAQLQASTNQTLAIVEVQTASWQRVDIVERLSKDLVMESVNLIDCERLGYWKPKEGCHGR